MKALESQVGGNHYKNLAVQPIELITALKCSFIQGSIIKYVTRYKHKNGVQDLMKCIHFARLALELKDSHKCNPEKLSLELNRYILKNKMTILQRRIITQVVYNNYARVIQYCKDLIAIDYPDEKIDID